MQCLGNRSDIIVQVWSIYRFNRVDRRKSEIVTRGPAEGNTSYDLEGGGVNFGAPECS